MKKLFKLKYSKLAVLILSIIITYVLFTNKEIIFPLSHLGNLSYVVIFFAGMLFSFGFTTSFAVGILIVIEPPNILLAALIGGTGAALSDLFIFKIIKISLMDEFEKIKNTAPIKSLRAFLENNIAAKIRVYILYAFAGLIIASPVPDEIGMAMLAGLTSVKAKKLAIISFVCNTIGIFVILILSH